MIKELNKDDLLIETSDGREPEPCSAYNNGYCSEFKKGCDWCYENSINFLRELL